MKVLIAGGAVAPATMAPSRKVLTPRTSVTTVGVAEAVVEVLIAGGAVEPATMAHAASEAASGLRAPPGPGGLLAPEEALLW